MYILLWVCLVRTLCHCQLKLIRKYTSPFVAHLLNKRSEGHRLFVRIGHLHKERFPGLGLIIFIVLGMTFCETFPVECGLRASLWIEQFYWNDYFSPKRVIPSEALNRKLIGSHFDLVSITLSNILLTIYVDNSIINQHTVTESCRGPVFSCDTIWRRPFPL